MPMPPMPIKWKGLPLKSTRFGIAAPQNTTPTITPYHISNGQIAAEKR
jgi:hypothetical protein